MLDIHQTDCTLKQSFALSNQEFDTTVRNVVNFEPKYKTSSTGTSMLMFMTRSSILSNNGLTSHVAFQLDNTNQEKKKRKYYKNDDCNYEQQVKKKKEEQKPYHLSNEGPTMARPQPTHIYLEWMKRRNNTEQVYEFFILNREQSCSHSDNDKMLDE